MSGSLALSFQALTCSARSFGLWARCIALRGYTRHMFETAEAIVYRKKQHARKVLKERVFIPFFAPKTSNALVARARKQRSCSRNATTAQIHYRFIGFSNNSENRPMTCSTAVAPLSGGLVEANLSVCKTYRLLRGTCTCLGKSRRAT